MPSLSKLTSFYFCSFNCFSRAAALARSRFSGAVSSPTRRLLALFAFPQTVTLHQGTIESRKVSHYLTVEVESDYIRMGDSRRPTPSHRLNAYCTVIVRVSYGYGYTRGSGRVWLEIFGAGRVRVRVASSATGTGRVAEMVDHRRLASQKSQLEFAHPDDSLPVGQFSRLS